MVLLRKNRFVDGEKENFDFSFILLADDGDTKENAEARGQEPQREATIANVVIGTMIRSRFTVTVGRGNWILVVDMIFLCNAHAQTKVELKKVRVVSCQSQRDMKTRIQ